MTIKKYVVLIMLLFLMAAANAYEARKGDVKVSVGADKEGLIIHGEVGGKPFGPRVLSGYKLIREGPDPIAIFSNKNRRGILISAFSGGAHCCWDVFWYDLNTMEPIRIVTSRSPVEFSEKNNNIGLKVKIVDTELDDWNAPYVKYTYDFKGLVVDLSREAVQSYVEQVAKAIKAVKDDIWDCEDLTKRTEYFQKLIGKDENFYKVMRDAHAICPEQNKQGK